jgi:Uma2 family endonuclease
MLSTPTKDKPAVQRKIWTREEYDRLIALGGHPCDSRVQLLNGELWDMSSQGPRHAYVIHTLNRILQRLIPEQSDLLLLSQLPLALSEHSEPEPDCSIVRAEAKVLAGKTHPTSAELVIEVSDTSLVFDQQTQKIRLCRGRRFRVLDCRSERRLHVGTSQAGRGRLRRTDRTHPIRNDLTPLPAGGTHRDCRLYSRSLRGNVDGIYSVYKETVQATVPSIQLELVLDPQGGVTLFHGHIRGHGDGGDRGQLDKLGSARRDFAGLLGGQRDDQGELAGLAEAETDFFGEGFRLAHAGEDQAIHPGPEDEDGGAHDDSGQPEGDGRGHR